MAARHRWSDLKGYSDSNPFGIWSTHPSRPAMLYFNRRHGYTGNRDKNWTVYVPRETDPGVYSERKSKSFDSFGEAVEWAKRRLGIKGWRYVTVNRIGAWLPDDDSDEVACERHVYSESGGSGACGRRAIPGEMASKHSGSILRESNDMVPICSLHSKQKARVAAEVAVREERIAQQQAKRDREKENERAAADYVARLAGFGIKSEIAYDMGGKCHAAVALQGEMAVRLVEEIAMLRRELGLPDLEEEPIR